MTTRERIKALLHYQDVDQIPLLHAGFWPETLEKWYKEGHITAEEAGTYDHVELGDFIINCKYEKSVATKLGLDDNIDLFVAGQKEGSYWDLPVNPPFEWEVVETYEDGSQKVRDTEGAYIKVKPGAQGIPTHLGYSLVDRESWEKDYLPRMKWKEEQVDMELLNRLAAESETRDFFMNMYCGSLYGKMRNFWGVEEISCLQYEDPELFEECMETAAEVYYQNAKKLLSAGVQWDAGAYWEDICYNRGPLIGPENFQKYTAHNYRRMSDLLHSHGIDIIMVDCDGLVDELVPTWLDNGVNTLWPMEYGAWECDFSTLRAKFGKELLCIGNINKKIFAWDKAAIDKEIERIKRLIDLGGYVPCMDHSIPPDAEWDMVRYFVDRFREIKR